MDPQNPRPLFDFDLNELPPPDDGGTVDASTPPQDDGGKFDDASTTAPGREPSPEYDATADASQADCLSPSQQMLDLDAPLSPMYDDDEEEDYGELQLPSPDPLYETDETEVACSPEKMTSGGCSPVIYPQRWRPQHHRRRGRTSMPESTWPRRRTHLLAWTCKARSLRSTSPRADTAGEHGGRTARRRRRLQLSPCGHRRRRHRHRHRALMPTSQRGQTTRRRLLRTGRASSGGSPCHATTLPPTPSLSSTVATTTRTLPGLPAEGSAEARPPTRRHRERGRRSSRAPPPRDQQAPRRTSSYKPYDGRDQRGQGHRGHEKRQGYRGDDHGPRGYAKPKFPVQQVCSDPYGPREDSYGGRQQIPAQEAPNGGYHQYREPPRVHFPAGFIQRSHPYVSAEDGAFDGTKKNPGNQRAVRDENRPDQHRRRRNRRQYYKDPYSQSPSGLS